MIPVKLELQGLYSYKEKQTIDFEQLTAAGLFGIFGAVGSGKSSILEAIMLSLYGNTERLAARGEKTSMVNLQSDLLSIAFEFRGGRNNSETYKAVYTSKRNKKKFEDIKPAEHLFYHRTSEGWDPIEQDGETLVGMKMEHFKQTVIIPQGKFREFIEQKPLARAEMMKELFGLERFDLSSQTGSLVRRNNEEKIRIQTQMQSLESISLDTQQEKQTLLKELGLQKEEKAQELAKLEATFSQWKTFREKHQTLLQLEERDRQLHAEKPGIERKTADLKKYRKAEAYIRPVLAQLKEREVELEKYDVSLNECVRWKTDYEERVFQLEAEEEKLRIGQSKRGEREAKIRDLQKIIIINALEAEVAKNQQAVDQLLPQSQESKLLLLKLRQQIINLERKEETIKAPDAKVLADLQNAARVLDEWESDLIRFSTEIDLLTQQKLNYGQVINGLLKMIPERFKDFGQWLIYENRELELLRSEKEKLIQQQGLSAFASKLKKGENCPLCGAAHHPVPLSHHFDHRLLDENAHRQKQLVTLIENIRKHEASYEKETVHLEGVMRNLSLSQEEIVRKKEKRAGLLGALHSQGIENAEMLGQRLQHYDAVLQEQQLLSKRLRQIRRDYEKHQEKYDQDEKKLRNAEQKLLALHASLSTQKEQIKLPEFSFKFLSVPEIQIQKDIDVVQKVIDELEVNIKRNQDRLKETRQGQTTNLANLHHFSNLLEETKEKYRYIQQDLKRQLEENEFSTVQEAQQLLEGLLDPEKWEKEIKSYYSQVEVVMERLQELNANPAIREFKEEAFQELSSQLKSHDSFLEQLKSQITLLNNEILELRIKLQHKEALAKELGIVEKRETNLKELERLFKGNGFVKYVSSIYLRELCHTANVRFMKLTKNSLSLEIDEDNNFWVRDYLNGGKRRLLKSLSGGQTFQASLCLSLALAEKVKSLNRADQSFFFLDEGFGSLDKASLRTVFEALKSLRHEKRIVGIISHVEELQQEIEVYAKIELDGESGSQVSYSF